MPVEDHEVHDKVRVGADHRYGCNSVRKPNRSMKGYYAPNRVYKPDGTFYVVQHWIEHTNTTACRSFALWDTDTACSDCKTERDEEYAEKMKGLE